MSTDWRGQSPNPMDVSDSMVQRAAEVLLADELEDSGKYAAERLTWEDFADQALRVLNAALTDTRWEDR